MPAVATHYNDGRRDERMAVDARDTFLPNHITRRPYTWCQADCEVDVTWWKRCPWLSIRRRCGCIQSLETADGNASGIDADRRLRDWRRARLYVRVAWNAPRPRVALLPSSAGGLTDHRVGLQVGYCPSIYEHARLMLISNRTTRGWYPI